MDCTIRVTNAKALISLRCYHEADLCLCFRICKKLVSHDAAYILFALMLLYVTLWPLHTIGKVSTLVNSSTYAAI